MSANGYSPDFKSLVVTWHTTAAGYLPTRMSGDYPYGPSLKFAGSKDHAEGGTTTRLALKQHLHPAGLRPGLPMAQGLRQPG